LSRLGRAVPTFRKLGELRLYPASVCPTAELPQLRQSLQALGFREVLLTARRLREMAPEQELKFISLSLGVPPDVQLLNVKV